MANNILKIKTTQGVPKYVHDLDPARYHDRFHTIKKIEKDTDRDNFLDATAAKSYGIVDSILEERG